jgi:hypothetical protein
VLQNRPLQLGLRHREGLLAVLPLLLLLLLLLLPLEVWKAARTAFLVVVTAAAALTLVNYSPGADQSKPWPLRRLGHRLLQGTGQILL